MVVRSIRGMANATLSSGHNLAIACVFFAHSSHMLSYSDEGDEVVLKDPAPSM